MKRTLILAVVLAAGIGGLMSPAVGQVSISISFGDFYNSLGPYGEWVYVDQGVYAWRPVRIVSGWRPYTYGRWVWSAYGWYWVSDEPWSWAVYHYGRWHCDDWYGWIWIPGYDWAPAWVEWRYGPDYVGWAPLGPYALFSVSHGVYYSQAYRAPYDYWTFVSHGHMTRPNVYRYRYQGDDIRRVYGESRATGTVRYRDGIMESRGPDREYVERRGNVRIGTAEVVDVNDYSRVRATREGRSERIEVYRPHIRRDEAERSVRPDRVAPSDRAPSIDSRYLDERMRPQLRDDDQGLEGRARGKIDRWQPEVRPRSLPSVRPDDRQRNRQEVRPAAPRQPSAREAQPAVKEQSRKRDSRPEAPRDRKQPEPKSRTR